MALPDSLKLVVGTVLVFSNSGEYSPTAGQPSGTDADLDLQAATTGVAVESAKVDFGAVNLDALYSMRAYIETFSAPTAGGTVEIYANWSTSGTAATDNMANCSGVDGVYQGYGADTASGTEALPQLDFLGSMVFTADTDIQVSDVAIFAPKERYMSLVVVNNTSITLAATDAIESCIAVWPLQHQVQD